MPYLSPYKLKNFRESGSLLTDLCPWVIMADEGIVLLKNGALAQSYEFTAPDLGSSSSAKIASAANMFNSTVMQLGEGWAVQFELQRRMSNEYPGSSFENTAGFFVERQREINFSYTAAHYENRYFLTLTYQLPPEIQQRSSGIFYRRGTARGAAQGAAQGAVYDGLNKGLIDNEIKNFKMTTAKTVSVLQSCMRVDPLDSEQLFTFLHSSVSLDWHKMNLPEEYKLFLDRAVTDMDLETSIPLKLGEYYIPVLAVKAFPAMTIPAMFDALNKADTPLRWSTRFICYSKETALKRIDKAEKKFHSQRKSIGQWVLEATAKIQTTRENAGAHAQESDAQEARVECTMGNCGFGEYTSNVLVWDKDIDAAEDTAAYIAGLIGACGFSVKQETHNALQAFLSMQPGNVYANIRRLFVSTGNMSHVIPISSVWSGLKENLFTKEICGQGRPHVVCSTNYGIPFFLNLNNKDVGHHWVSGPTGAGKSTYLALLEIQWLKYPGAQVVIFDKGLSARCVTMCAGGIYLEPGKDSIAFQPLAELETPEQQRWAAEFIECLLVEQHVAVTALMRKTIFDTIKLLSSREDVESRTLTSFQGYSCDYENPETKRNDIYDGLTPYVLGGQYGELFDSMTTNLPLSSWVMFEMQTLMAMSQGAVAPALLFLFRQCEKLFDGKPTLLILDEAWLFLKNSFFAAKITEWLKTLRKKHVFCVFAAQEIDDAAKSSIASTIISQCGSKVYLADDEAMTPMIHDAYLKFGLEEAEIALIGNPAKSRKKRDYFFKSPLGTRQFQLDLDRLQLAIMTNSPDDHKLLDEIEKKFGKNTGRPLVEEILKAKKVDYAHLIQGGTPS